LDWVVAYLKKRKNKSSLYTRLQIFVKKNFFSYIQVSGAICAALRQGTQPHTSGLQRWRVVDNVWEIWSVPILNSIPSCTSGRHLLPPAPSGRLHVFTVFAHKKYTNDWSCSHRRRRWGAGRHSLFPTALEI